MSSPITLVFNGQAVLFALLIGALVFSLTCHEFGHALVAKRFGDDTAERAGRLTLNPLAHIDPFGLLMVVYQQKKKRRKSPSKKKSLRRNRPKKPQRIEWPFFSTFDDMRIDSLPLER